MNKQDLIILKDCPIKITDTSYTVYGRIGVFVGQKIDMNINAINAYTSEINMPKQPQTEKNVAACADYKYEYVAEKNNDLKVNNTMDNFDDYLKNKEKKEQEEAIDERSKEEKAKEDAKEIRTRLSSEEIKQLEMMGIDVTGASLSDLMSMVNTMRANAHKEETAELFARIKAADGDISNMTVIGGQLKINGTNFKIDNKELTYLVRNNLNITTENMYKAHFSGSNVSNACVDDEVINAMSTQLSDIIEMSGYKDDPLALEGAKFMLGNELPVTTDSIKLYMDYQQLVGKNIQDLELPYDNAEFILAKSESLYMEVNSWDYSSIEEVLGKLELNETASGDLTGNNLSDKELSYIQNNSQNNSRKNSLASIANSRDLSKLNNISEIRQIQEIRLSMTLRVAKRMVSLDVNVDTRELSKTVEIMKKAEASIAKEELTQAGLEINDENLDILLDIKSKVYDIRQAHAAILATPLRDKAFTVNSLHSQIENNSYKSLDFEAVMRSYEAVGTAPRADMGDSMAKAFSNVDDILREMSMEINYESQRAVRILGYNSMEITVENIESVIGYDRQVNQLMNSFYPEAVLGIIKDGINPLDIPIDELNDIIKNRNYNAGVSEAKNFASYLRNMENMGEVSPEERESYIGIYRMMDKLNKSGDKEAGWLFANGGQLTIRNLVSAARSRKAKGIDTVVDDSFGMLESLETKGKGITEQIESAFSPESGEEFEKYRTLKENVEEFILQNNIEYSVDNAMAVDVMLNSSGGIYEMVSDIMSKLKFSSNSKEELIDEETENMSDSLQGEQIGAHIIEELAQDKILNELREDGNMSLRYENIRDMVTEFMYEQAAIGKLNSLDIASIKTINAGLNVMRNLSAFDKYQIPVETTEGIKVMNLTIVSDSENAGNIRISINDSEMGNITANITLSEDDSLWGYIASDTSAGNYALIEKSEQINNMMSHMGINSEEIEIGTLRQNQLQERKYGEVRKPHSKARLYNISVSLVKTISNILS